MTDRNWDFEALGSQAAAQPDQSAPSTATAPIVPLPPAAPVTQSPVAPVPAQAPVLPAAPVSPPAQAPVSPPARPNQYGGPPLTPVAPAYDQTQPLAANGPQRPPTEAESKLATTPTIVTSSPWGWRALAAFLAGGLLTATGFGVAQWNNEPAAPAVIDATDTTPTTANSGQIVVAPPDLDTDEPAAFVAALLGPSVVQVETDLGLGSGVIYADGLVLTNHHVIQDASQVRVRLSDGRTLDGEIVGSDPRTDIAVISAGAGLGLPVAQLAVDDPLEVGELTIAIGSPFQLQQTVTSGIVSAVNRPIFNGAGWNAMVQTDAAINPGNSGGALANRQGQVIGINTAIQTDGISNTNAGIGFAMPIRTVADVASRIVNGEPLEPGFLGVEGTEPAGGEVGVEIADVTAGSAAADAGLQVGDIVTSVDGAPVTAFQELAGLIQTSFPGDEVVLVLIRDGESLSITAVLGER